MTGDEIRQLRKGASLTQKALAKQLGVSRETVSRWEAQRQQPTALHARHFGYVIRDLREAAGQRELPM